MPVFYRCLQANLQQRTTVRKSVCWLQQDVKDDVWYSTILVTINIAFMPDAISIQILLSMNSVLVFVLIINFCSYIQLCIDCYYYQCYICIIIIMCFCCSYIFNTIGYHNYVVCYLGPSYKWLYCIHIIFVLVPNSLNTLFVFSSL